MNRQPFEKPPQWWAPKLSPAWIRFWSSFRLRDQRRKQQLHAIEVQGAERVRQALDDGCGVLITPNHPSHADAFTLYSAADAMRSPLYVMVAWQVFSRGSWLRRRVLQRHGCFSVDREGTDMTALRKAREILESEPVPLVIFPEGEVYHLNDRLTPFRQGPAAIALMAARKASRPIVCAPCAMKYRYVEDPTAELTALMGRLEQAVHWRPRPDLGLQERVYHLAEGVLALKEIEILGQTHSGPLPERIARLIDFLLCRLEVQYELESNGLATPERVKAARRHVIGLLEKSLESGDPCESLYEDLDDLFLVVQIFSYPGDYVAERPCIERLAETLDKLEEDVLGVATASIRGARTATVTFGEPVVLPSGKQKGVNAAELTKTLETRVQELLDNQPDS